MFSDPTPNIDLPGSDRPAPPWFQSFANTAADWSGSRWVFLSALLLIVAWIISGPWFHFSDTWQLIINTVTSISTFLMVFLIQNTQNRDAKAIHLKLNEIIRALHPAKNEMISVEQLSDAELDRLRNLIFLRHLENPDGAPRQESFHVLFMTQSLERAGDHAKNLAEEVCHLVSGHSVRHVLRAYDRPVEQMFIDDLKRRQKNAR